jgi:NADPH:quinone reductase-like Zn-dependent oxidoreductase
MSLLFNELTATARAGLNGYHSTIQRRALCATAVPLANRAIVYSRNGDPASVLLALSYPALPQPAPNTVNLKFLLSSVNPADLNVIEGVYPSKPTPRTNLAASGLGSVDQPAFIAGNEGLAEITAVGSGVTALQTGDWVIMTGTQVGTWASSTNVAANQVLKLPLPRGSGLTPVQGATISVGIALPLTSASSSPFAR